MENKIERVEMLNEESFYKLIEEKKYHTLKEILSEMNEVNVAELLEDLSSKQLVLIFRLLPKDLANDVFSYFSKEKQWEIINTITEPEVKDIVEELYFDDMIDLIDDMPANVVKKVLKHANPEERNLINEFLRYPDESAGSLMTIEFVDLKKNFTAKEALKKIRKIGMSRETIYTCYILDDTRKLEGILSLRELVIANPETILEDIMETDIIYCHTHDTQEEVSMLFSKYGFIAIPVVDNEKRLTGIITVDDIMEVMEQETTEDFHLMASMSPSEEEYLDTPIRNLSKNRLPWLLLLMISATFTGTIMMKFETVLSKVAILSTFIPMLLNTGGNTSNQASTIIIREIALGNIDFPDWFRVVWKEIRVAVINGSILAFVNFLRLIYITRVPVEIALTVSMAMILCIFAAQIVGASLPILAKKFNLDPAIMAGPLISTILDALTLLIYLSIAKMALNI